MKLLDNSGLSYFWSKIKAKLSEKVDIVGNLTVSRHPSSSGYLKFAECDLSRGGYGNKYVVLFMTTEYATNGKDGNGIVYINIRGNGTSQSSVSNFYWLLNEDSTSIDTLYWAVSDHKIEFYRKVFASNEYAQVSFKVLHIGNFENARYWTFELNNVPFVEGTPLDTPIGDVHAIVSGGKVKNAERATGDKNGKDITSTYISYTTSSQSVVGNTKNVSKINPETIYVPNGLIMGGTAQQAGLVTRGICGIYSPDGNGACAKEHLYINYDGNNDFNAGRQIVSSAGGTGNHLGSNMYQYTLPRGEIVKNWVESKGYTSNTGTITGVSVNGTSVATSGVANITSLPASILNGEIKNGVTATTQTNGDNSKKVATTAYVDNAVNNVQGAGTPIGTILAFGGANAPSGYLLCDGSAISRTDYSELFGVIGTIYGSGDGSSTFNLPNLQRRYPLMKGDNDTLGATGGSEVIYALANPTSRRCKL